MAEGRGDDDIPRDAKIVKSLLNSMGVKDYEPRVVQQFLELWYRYVTDVLIDSQVYSEHAGKSVIDYDDVKLAIQSKANFSHSQPPPREMLLELGRSINKNPLQLSVAGRRNHLPPEQDTLINPNYHLALSRKLNLQAMVEETEEDEKAMETNSNPSQEQKANASVQAATHQRVSFPLVQKRK